MSEHAKPQNASSSTVLLPVNNPALAVQSPSLPTKTEISCYGGIEIGHPIKAAKSMEDSQKVNRSED